jgi:hypothetical protein
LVVDNTSDVCNMESNHKNGAAAPGAGGIAMSVIRKSVSVALASALCLAFGAVVGADDDPLGRAKELYRSAAYDEALGILDTISTSAASEIPK